MDKSNNVFIFSDFISLPESLKLKDSIVVLQENNYYTEFEAICKITKNLHGFWGIFRAINWLPPFLGNRFYRLFAKNRYLFNKPKSNCKIN